MSIIFSQTKESNVYMIKNRKSLMFQIPLKIAGIVTAVMLVICIALNILLNSIISGDVKSEISYISKHNANIAQAYLENLQTTSKALAMEVNRYRSLDKESAERMLKNSLTGILKDDRIFSAYYAFEPDRFFEDTPQGLSYYAFRDGAEQMGKGNLDTRLDESKIHEDEPEIS